MYDLLTRISQIEKTVPYQPSYPLQYDGTYGPWKPILSKEESLRQDFKFLLLTEPGEWPMNPDLGVGIRRYLFENFSADSLRGVEARIHDQLQKYLPRVKLISATFDANPDEIDRSKVSLLIKYVLMGSTQEVSAIQMGEKGYLNMETKYSSSNGNPYESNIAPLASEIKKI